MQMKKLMIITLAMSAALCAMPMSLSLDSCRALAIANNKELQMADRNVRSAYYERKAAFTKYFPRISASGAYIHTSEELSLLSDRQKGALNNIGSSLGLALSLPDNITDALDGFGEGLVDALHTDTRNAGVVSVILTQPIYTGGKIRAYNEITRYAERLARRRQDMALQDVIVEVDEAYWRIVSLESRRRLAESYLKLVTKLDGDVQAMVDEGMATRADELSVCVKVNEANVAMIQVTNGLSLARMLLCQLCGLDLDTPVVLDDENFDDGRPDPLPLTAETDEAFSMRPELDILLLASDISRQRIALARSEFLPTVALTGGYVATNPSVFNSFERRMKGMWSVGLVIKVPLLTSGERFFKVRAAREQAAEAVLRLDETREKVALQISQCRQRLDEAAERLRASWSSREQADENLRYAQDGVAEGVIPLSNLLEAQTAWLGAHAEHLNAGIDLRLANLYLQRAIGVVAQ